MVSPDRELYISITAQGVRAPTLIASAMGGMEIEAVAAEHPEEILRMEPVVRKALGPEFAVFRSEAYHLEILPAGVDKGSGLLRTLEYLGIPREAAVSCGDYDNDIPMNEAAGLGVAMENGCQEIREKADYVTCSNEEDGVAAVIEKFVLGEERI